MSFNSRILRAGPQVFFTVLAALSLLSASAESRAGGPGGPGVIDNAPPCLAQGRAFPVNNDAVIHWKTSTPNQWLSRANVTGLIAGVFPDRNGHNHFVISLDAPYGTVATNSLEVIYNEEFGATPEPRLGMRVHACGDYITSTQAAGNYPPSPAGAIIHWIHLNPRPPAPGVHDSGFLMIDNVVYGQSIPSNVFHGPNRPPGEQDGHRFEHHPGRFYYPPTQSYQPPIQPYPQRFANPVLRPSSR